MHHPSHVSFAPNVNETSDMLRETSIDDYPPEHLYHRQLPHIIDDKVEFVDVPPAATGHVHNYTDEELQRHYQLSSRNRKKDADIILERQYPDQYDPDEFRLKEDGALPVQDEFEEYRQRALSIPHDDLTDHRPSNQQRKMSSRDVSPDPDKPQNHRRKPNSRGVSPDLDKSPIHEDKHSPPKGAHPLSHLPGPLKKLFISKDDPKQDIVGLQALPAKMDDTHHWRGVPEEEEQKEFRLKTSPGEVEERFLQLPESEEYDKVRSFDVNKHGDIVESELGYVYREKSPSPTTVGSNSVRRYTILIIGTEEVGKTSLVNQLRSCDSLDADRLDASQDSNDVLPVLIAGREVDLLFVECDAHKNKSWNVNMNFSAIVVMYTVTDKKSFNAASDILYQLSEKFAEYLPIILVANKIDLERLRAIETEDGKQLAKEYNCKFIEVSVLLGCETNELLKELLLRLQKSEKRNSLVNRDGKFQEEFHCCKNVNAI